MNFKKFCEERGLEGLYSFLLSGKRMVDDWLAPQRLAKIERDVKRIRNSFSSRYFPEMIDYGQILRRDGRKHNWVGGVITIVNADRIGL